MHTSDSLTNEHRHLQDTFCYQQLVSFLPINAIVVFNCRVTWTKLFRVTQLPNKGRTRNSNKSKPTGTIWIFLLWAAYKMQSNFYPYFDQHCTPPSLKFTDPASISVYPIFKGINFHCLFPYSCRLHLLVHTYYPILLCTKLVGKERWAHRIVSTSSGTFLQMPKISE